MPVGYFVRHLPKQVSLSALLTCRISCRTAEAELSNLAQQNNWIRAEDWGPHPGKLGILFFVIKSRPPLVVTQFPVKWTPKGFLAGSKAVGHHSLLLEERLKKCGAMLPLPMCLHGILFNQLSCIFSVFCSLPHWDIKIPRTCNLLLRLLIL
jgi:hypothetical protein